MASKLKDTGETIEVWFVVKETERGVSTYDRAFVSRQRAQGLIDHMLARIATHLFLRDGTFNVYGVLESARIVTTKRGERLVVHPKALKPLQLSE